MWFKRGDDGLTNRERKKLAKSYWKVASMPVSLGTRAVAWARQNGFEMEPWQERLLREFIDERDR